MASTPAELLVRNRFLGFLFWQYVLSAFIFIFVKFFLLSPIYAFSFQTAFPPVISLPQFYAFLTFQLSQLLFSCSLAATSSPHRPPPLQYWRNSVLFVVVSAVAGTYMVGALCTVDLENELMIWMMGTKGFSLGIGTNYGIVYAREQRWVLQFPAIEVSFFIND